MQTQQMFETPDQPGEVGANGSVCTAVKKWCSSRLPQQTEANGKPGTENQVPPTH